MTDLQTAKAFQKQEGVFLASKKVLAKKTSSGVRFYKKVGLGKSLAMTADSSRHKGAFVCVSDCLV